MFSKQATDFCTCPQMNAGNKIIQDIMPTHVLEHLKRRQQKRPLSLDYLNNMDGTRSGEMLNNVRYWSEYSCMKSSLHREEFTH